MGTPKILVIMGYSRVGKDSTAKELQAIAKSPLVNVKFSQPMKAVLEYLYELPSGSLNDNQYRQRVIPGSSDGTTFLDVMVRSFDSFRSLDKNIMLHRTEPRIESELAQGNSVLLTDLRTHEEAQLVARLASQYPLHLLRIYRLSVTPKESDRYVDELQSYLNSYANRTTEIWNNRSLPELQTLLGGYAKTIEL